LFETISGGLMMAKLIEQSETKAFLSFLDGWIENLAEWKTADVFSIPQNSAVITIDMIKGFCNFGPLSSPRVNDLIQPVTTLLTNAWQQGVRQMILTQDTHAADALEFGSWPPHCIRGTEEAETIDEIKKLPFFEHMVKIEKNSIASGMNGQLGLWMQGHPAVDSFVVTGDCTDLCIYQLAMFLRLDANERQIKRRVIVPANCVDTYHLAVKEASDLGVLPHPGNFSHAYFLYHMALNGIEICKTIL
jgi:nicotinamidase-related amidase